MSFWINLLKLIYTLWLVTVYAISMVLVVLPFLFLNLFFSEKRGYHYFLRFIHYWSAVWGFLCGIRYEVIDRDKVPNNRSYIFVCNHRSNLDAMIWGFSNNYMVKGLAKKELTKVPFLGFIFKTTCVIVDRSSKESRRESLENMKEVARSNMSIFFFPEGTRNKTEKPLQPFYDGAFRAAIELQLPIAPLVMCNSGELMPGGSFLYKPGKVKCVFLDPISTEGLKEDDLPELKERVFNIMEKAILENEDRFKRK